MNLEELRQANMLVQEIRTLEKLSESELEYLRVRYPDFRYDSVSVKDKLKGKIQKVIEDYTDELKAELKELGVNYE